MTGIGDLATYMISLPRAVDRRRAMESQLANLKLPYTLMPGVDGRVEWDRLVAEADLVAFSRVMGRAALPGDLGCYHAHLDVWRAFLTTGAPAALVLEDDVVFHDDFLEALGAALSCADAWDVLKLNRIRAKQPVTQGHVGKFRMNAYLGPATGLGAYLINRATAERLLGRMLPVTRPIDHEMDRPHIHRYRLIGLEPFPSHVDDHGVSMITGQGGALLQKRVWYRRLPSYGARWRALAGKALYLCQTGAIWPRAKQL